MLSVLLQAGRAEWTRSLLGGLSARGTYGSDGSKPFVSGVEK